MIPLECSRDNTLADVKAALWVETLQYPALARRLKKPEQYAFSCVNQEAEMEDLADEGKALHEVRFFKRVLKLTERRGNKAEKLLNAQIGNVIGKALYVYSLMKDPEIDDFRRAILTTCKTAVEERWARIQAGDDLYAFDPTVCTDAPPANVLARLTARGTLLCNVAAEHEVEGGGGKRATNKFVISVGSEETPLAVVRQVLKKLKPLVVEGALLGEEAYAVKVSGRRVYLLGEHRLVDYADVRRLLAAGTSINLRLVEKRALREQCPAERELPHWLDAVGGGAASTHDYLHSTRTQVFGDTLWKMEQKLRVKIVGAKNVNAGDTDGLYWKVGIYHGGRNIAPLLKTRTVAPAAAPEWDEELVFDIRLRDLPRACRLCFTLYGMWQLSDKTTGSNKKRVAAASAGAGAAGDITYNAHGVAVKKELVPLGWVNLNLFKYTGVLNTGLVELNTWPCESAADSVKAGGNPIGTTVSNPDRSYGGGAVALTVQLERHPHPVVFPSDHDPSLADQQIDYAAVRGPEPQQKEAKRIRRIINKDPLAKIGTKDKALLWRYRFSHKHEPKYLPKLLMSVPWNNCDIVREVRALVKLWAPLLPQDALELLDSNFGDQRVRSFAVRCLENIDDERLCEYLPQLVQVLKYESYLDCDLARFLLRRALANPHRIGHFFFWHLRAEMHQADVVVRYGLLLEAYCRGCGSHMRTLAAQTEAMGKLVDVANRIKAKELKTKEMKLEVLRDGLRKLKIAPFQLPHEPEIVVHKLNVEKCKFMDSKKLPLWLNFDNFDGGGSVLIIFKAGDDLRQDMLTIQLLTIMDNIWKKENLDLKMIPYGCISTGDEVGMIEVVVESSTICNIQKEKGGQSAISTFKDDPLAKWLIEHNPDPKDYQQAVDMFVLSCAGYSVATYVLGIGDRHNDNIMLNRFGQLFHIDFGHFLGNFKSKFGVKRERVPFVLTPDFVYVMGGKEGKDSEQFRKFKQLCIDAYLILRKHANLFINLFAMMLSTGIPELKEPADISYLRDVLCIGLSAEDAAASFEKELETAMAKSWSTRINWFIHSAVH